jgi:hypothetical protein
MKNGPRSWWVSSRVWALPRFGCFKGSGRHDKMSAFSPWFGNCRHPNPGRAQTLVFRTRAGGGSSRTMGETRTFCHVCPTP